MHATLLRVRHVKYAGNMFQLYKRGQHTQANHSPLKTIEGLGLLEEAQKTLTDLKHLESNLQRDVKQKLADQFDHDLHRRINMLRRSVSINEYQITRSPQNDPEVLQDFQKAKHILETIETIVRNEH